VGVYWLKYDSGDYIYWGAPVIVDSSADTWSDANLVNTSYRITHQTEDNTIDESFTAADQTGGPIWVDGDWTFVTNGSWVGTVELQKSVDYGRTWIAVGSPLESASGGGRNWDLSGTETEDDILYRVECTAYTSGPIQVIFTNENNFHDGAVYIDEIVDDDTAKGYVTTAIYCISGTAADATERWAEGAWSTFRGFPRTVTFFEDRLVFGGNAYKPDTIWASVTGDYTNMKTGADDDDALDFTLSSNQINAIQWILGKSKLLIGTAGGEWSMAGSNEEPLTPSNVKAELQSTYGSQYLQANLINEGVLFFQRQAWKMRELAYNWELDSYVAPDMTILAKGITGDGITQTAYQQTPDSILWCVREDGELLSFSYERKEEVTAWARHITDGNFLSVACIHSDTGEDEVWAVVERVIDSTTVKYMEYFSARDFGTDVNDAYFVDCGKTYTTNVLTISDLTWLEGETLYILADGDIHPTRTVSSSSITLDATYQTVHVGLPYTLQIKTMPLSYLTQGSTIHGRIKRINEVIARFYNSGDFYIGKDTSNLELISLDRMQSSDDVETETDKITFPPGEFMVY
jgi:hypothetical protein